MAQQNCRICGSIETTYSGPSSVYGACNDCTRRAIEELEEREKAPMRKRIDTMEARREGIHLESVGTWLHHDGWTYPVWADDTVTIPANGASLDARLDCEGHHLEDIEREGDGFDWYSRLDLIDDGVVELVLRLYTEHGRMAWCIEEARKMRAIWSAPDYSGTF